MFLFSILYLNYKSLILICVSIKVRHHSFSTMHSGKTVVIGVLQCLDNECFVSNINCESIRVIINAILFYLISIDYTFDIITSKTIEYSKKSCLTSGMCTIHCIVVFAC